MHILVAGFGSAGRRHIANLQHLCQDFKLTVLTATDLESVQCVSPGARVIGRIDEASLVKPDAAIIANTSHLHAPLLASLLSAGIPCYIEKPVVTTRAQVLELRALLTELDRVPVTLTGCNLRYLPSLIRLRQQVQTGAAGRIVRAVLQAGQWLPDWRPESDYRVGYGAKGREGGGVILDLVHEIDQARWLFGDFANVQAMAGRLSSLEIDAEDTACLLFGNPGVSPLVSVNLDYVSRRRVRRYEIVGEDATLIWDLPGEWLERVHAGGREVIDCGPSGFDVAQTYRAALSEFLSCVESGEPASQDIREGLASTELALRAREAAGL